MGKKREIRASAAIMACAILCAGLGGLLWPGCAFAHGTAGKRFFPATMAVDDPFVSDEFSLLFNHIREPDEKTNELSFSLGKRITNTFGIEIGDAYRFVKPDGEKEKRGFGNLEVGAKYQFFTNGEHEMLFSVGLEAEVGGTGNSSVGVDSFSTISPAFLFGKGFGDLPDSMKYLKPFAITGTIGPNFPTRSKNVTLSEDQDTGFPTTEVERNPVTLSSGITVQYNLQYLQSFVKDVGLPAPFNRMIPLVEFPLETCLNRGCGGNTTGFVNPGVIWFGKSIQLGAEAQIPLNSDSGKDVGVVFMLHLFIDDLLPGSLGRPLIR